MTIIPVPPEIEYELVEKLDLVYGRLSVPGLHGNHPGTWEVAFDEELVLIDIEEGVIEITGSSSLLEREVASLVQDLIDGL
jgi:hypothetical protein